MRMGAGLVDHLTAESAHAMGRAEMRRDVEADFVEVVAGPDGWCQTVLGSPPECRNPWSSRAL